MKDKLYFKEWSITILFIVILMVFGHTVHFFVLFPSLKGGTMWGFPIHYIIPILTGWFGLLAVTTVMAVVLNKFDDEMDEYTESLERRDSTVTDRIKKGDTYGNN